MNVKNTVSGGGSSGTAAKLCCGTFGDSVLLARVANNPNSQAGLSRV